MIPHNLREFFWDIDAEAFEPREYPHYTIIRLLEFGNLEAISWLKEQFSEDTIKEALRTERKLSPKSATFWALIYGIPSEEIAALTE